MSQEEFDINNILDNKEYIMKLKQKLNDSISIWGNEERLYIDESAKMVNTLFNTTSGKIIIGKNTFTGHNVSIITGTHDINKINQERMDAYPIDGRDIVIGDGVWIGSNSIILGPSTIGDNCVIAAGAVVTANSKIPPNTVVGGVPAKEIKKIYMQIGESEMSKDVTAKEVLEKIQHIEEGFIANGNENFTNIIKDTIKQLDWNKINKDNIGKMPKYIEQVNIDNTWSETHIKELNEYKDISQKIPPNTRFKLVKKIINKTMKVSTRYQEIFNNRLVGFLVTLSRKISTIESNIYSQNIMLEDTLIRVENETGGIKSKVEEANNKIGETNSKIEETNSKIEEFIDSNDKRIRGNESWSQLLSDRIDALESAIPKLRNELFAEIKHSLNGTEVFQTKNDITPRLLPSYKNYCVRNGDIKRVNVGCGTITKEDYINIDERELDGVDIVANVKNLPFRDNELTEIYAAHLLEHFDDETLRNDLIPYWFSLLKPNGKIRIIVPNIEKMIHQYMEKEIPFNQLKEVIFGGQEYSGNYHFTMFNEEKLIDLLEKVGFSDINVVSSGRKNGLCIEMEIEGTKK